MHASSLPTQMTMKVWNMQLSTCFNTHKSGSPTHKLQAITNLESESSSGKFMHVCSETLGQYISFLARRGYKVHGDILMFD